MNKYVKWLIVLAVAGGLAYVGYQRSQANKIDVPEGIAWGNGRVEAKLGDISAKEALRVAEVLVEEGDLVQKGQVVVKLDTVTLQAELAQARAEVAATEGQLAIANAAIERRKAEIELARIETERAGNLVRERAGSQRDYDVRKMALAATTALLAEEEARLASARQDVEVARAAVATIQTRIDDATLYSPFVGRVLYRLAEPGEVLAAGGRALTLVNLEDVYMEIYLPTEQAAALKVGAEARITVDHEPGRAAPAYVSFVSPEAQFTPKEVETRDEREKLMFRVKLQVPQEIVVEYVERIKTGTRGVGFVKLNDGAQWPDWLQNLVGPAARG
jgi:HlyD family secretion protein